MKVAVTGGAGFIGSNLVDALVARGDEVLILDDLSFGKREHLNPAARFIEQDIREEFELDRDVSAVFHLAAQTDVQTSVREPVVDARANVLGAIRVAEAARQVGAKIVFTSTGGAIYGECTIAATEDSPRNPLAPYGISKLCGEEYLMGWNRIHGSTHVVCRLGNVFGPRQDASLEGGVVAVFLDRFARGDETIIFGDGLQVRDFIYVGDVVAGLIAGSEHPTGGTFNIGTGRETTVLDLHRACAEAAGREAEARLEAPRLGDIRRSVLDVSRAQQVLGFTAATSLSDGLALTWAWSTGPR